MISKIYSSTVYEDRAYLVTVETDVHNGLPDFKIVGATSADVKDSRERVRVGIENAGFILPPKRITVSLAPAALKKNGTILDAAIAVSVLVSFGFINNENITEYMIFGEVALDGSLRPVEGLLFSILFGLEKGFNKFIIPREAVKECSILKDCEVFAFDNLYQLTLFLNGDQSSSVRLPSFSLPQIRYPLFSEVYGEKQAKTALIAAVAGGHRLLLRGGKEEYRRSLFKPLSGYVQQQYEDILIKAAYLGLHRQIDIYEPEIVGIPLLFINKGKADIKDGFSGLRGCIRVLEKEESIDREKVDFYSFYRCRCRAESEKNCICSPRQLKDYQHVFYKTMQEKADIVTDTGDPEEISDKALQNMYESSRRMQEDRFFNENYKYNAEIPDREVSRFCIFSSEAEEWFSDYSGRQFLDNSEKSKILRLSRTLADMEEAELIELPYLETAIKLRGIHE